VTPLQPRPITRDDRLDGFDCGNTILNEWLIARAWRNQMAGDSRTYLCLDADGGGLLGYYSLAAWTLTHEDIGGGWLRRNAPNPVSVILLGRLAVATTAKGRGLGHDLLADALSVATRAAQHIGARALVAEAIDDGAGRFYAHEGLWQSSTRPDLFYARLS
jgi:GNAT superfamily N-acetyltransferase